MIEKIIKSTLIIILLISCTILTLTTPYITGVNFLIFVGETYIFINLILTWIIGFLLLGLLLMGSVLILSVFGQLFTLIYNSIEPLKTSNGQNRQRSHK